MTLKRDQVNRDVATDPGPCYYCGEDTLDLAFSYSSEEWEYLCTDCEISRT